MEEGEMSLSPPFLLYYVSSINQMDKIMGTLIAIIVCIAVAFFAGRTYQEGRCEKCDKKTNVK